MEEHMKVSYRTKYRDLLAFNFYVYFRSPVFLGLLVIFLIVGIYPNWRAVIHSASDESLLYQIVLFAFLQAIPLVISSIFLALCLLLATIGKKTKPAFTDETITIGNDVIITLGDDVIISESACSRSEVQWTAIQKLVQTRSHIFLFVTQRRSLVTPKRAFDSDETYEKFWPACQAKVRTSPHRN
jgi:hypothetical protein